MVRRPRPGQPRPPAPDPSPAAELRALTPDAAGQLSVLTVVAVALSTATAWGYPLPWPLLVAHRVSVVAGLLLASVWLLAVIAVAGRHQLDRTRRRRALRRRRRRAPSGP